MSLIDKPRRLWRRLFRRNDYYGELLELAVEAQARFEAEHPVSYTQLQRQIALTQRVARLNNGKLVPELFDLATEAAQDWERVSKAALEEP